MASGLPEFFQHLDQSIDIFRDRRGAGRRTHGAHGLAEAGGEALDREMGAQHVPTVVGPVHR